MSPYATLGLPEGETDALAIRRAYAAALRAHRPDSDPEGFRRVRDAYEAIASGAAAAAAATATATDPEAPTATLDSSAPPAPADARPSETGSADSPPAPEADDGLPSDAPLDPALAERRDRVVARIHDALRPASGGRSDAAAKARVQAIVDALLEEPDGGMVLSLALTAALPVERHPVLDAWVTPKHWVAAVACGDLALASALLDRWIETEQWYWIADAAWEAQKTQVAVAGGAAVGVLLRLAFAAAVTSPSSARKLSDHLYASVPVQLRERIPFAALDARVLIGEEVARWRPEARGVLAGAIEREDWKPGDERRKGARALRKALARTPFDSITGTIIHRDFPKLSAWSRLGSKAPRAAAQATTGSAWRWIFPLAFGIFMAVRAYRSETSATKLDMPKYRTPPVHRFDPEALRKKLRESGDVDAARAFFRWIERRPGESQLDFDRRLSEAPRRVAAGESYAAVMKALTPADVAQPGR